MIKFILAIDNSNLVGKTDSKFGLAWHYPEDLKFYKNHTSGQINVMGHSTYKQIGRALPNRTTIVMSRDEKLELDDAIVISSKEELLSKYNSYEDIYVCGGVQIFNLFKDDVQEIILTRIDKKYDGDVYFDNIDVILKEFEMVSNEKGQTEELSFQVWRRI